MKMKTSAWLALLVLVSPIGALGDGGFVPASAFAKVSIPDQQALIRFANGTETLVIDTAFRGDGTNFAWIVPLPAEPKIEEATAGLFTTLQTIFQPIVIHDVHAFYGFALLLGVVLFIAIWRLRLGRSAIGTLAISCVLFLMLAMLLPAGLSQSVSLSAGRVNVLDRKTVGIYETATISSRDGAALVDWLSRNGFVPPTNFIPAIAAYAREGWLFVASKIRLDTPLSGSGRPHPLAFTFNTERPVYPLRLTAIGSESCQIDLFVFGPGRAESPNFKVERCAQPTYLPLDRQLLHWRLDELRVQHPLLRRLVDQSAVATKLTGRLTAQEMAHDALITWSPLRSQRLTLYSDMGAAVTAANIAVPILLVGLLMCYWSQGGETTLAKRLRRIGMILSSFAIVSWLMIYCSLPKTPVVVSRFPRLRMSLLHNYEIPLAVESEWARQTNHAGVKPGPDAVWVRQQLAQTSALRSKLDPYSQTNHFSGQAWREEDSPGNYIVRDTPTGIDYVWYDIDGAETVVPLFRGK
jgi:hypothetical protein